MQAPCPSWEGTMLSPPYWRMPANTSLSRRLHEGGPLAKNRSATSRPPAIEPMTSPPAATTKDQPRRAPGAKARRTPVRARIAIAVRGSTPSRNLSSQEAGGGAGWPSIPDTACSNPTTTLQAKRTTSPTAATVTARTAVHLLDSPIVMRIISTDTVRGN